MFGLNKKFNVLNPIFIETVKKALDEGAMKIAEYDGKYVCEYKDKDMYFAAYSPSDGQIKAVKQCNDGSVENVPPGYSMTGKNTPANTALLGAILPEILKDPEAKDIWENHPDRIDDLRASIMIRCAGKGKASEVIKLPPVVEEIPGIAVEEIQAMTPRVVLYE